MTSIVAISDSHIPTISRLPDELRKALSEADIIVHAGDETESTVFDELREIGRVIAVSGNMDSSALKLTLPERQLFTVERKEIGVAHGSGAPAGIQKRVRALFPENPDVIIYGHSHEAYVGTVEGALMVNPGPAGSGYAIITVAGEITARIVNLR